MEEIRPIIITGSIAGGIAFLWWFVKSIIIWKRERWIELEKESKNILKDVDKEHDARIHNTEIRINDAEKTLITLAGKIDMMHVRYDTLTEEIHRLVEGQKELSRNNEEWYEKMYNKLEVLTDTIMLVRQEKQGTDGCEKVHAQTEKKIYELAQEIKEIDKRIDKIIPR